MTIESAQAFIERLKTDGDFRNRVTAAETAEARKVIVEAEGFVFSPEEIGSEVDQLSLEEMELISGGCGDCGCGDWGDPFENTETKSGCTADYGGGGSCGSGDWGDPL
ncbi:MAG: Nif11-like leader peptide family natural product precursor [Deltaproteobacteria bacterium]|nr:Nif11-like leader peptide family natural product precursor [Deltaproteobacteria bacterium]